MKILKKYKNSLKSVSDQSFARLMMRLGHQAGDSLPYLAVNPSPKSTYVDESPACMNNKRVEVYTSVPNGDTIAVTCGQPKP